MFGGVYLWSAVVLASGLTALALWIRPTLAATPPLRTLDRALVAILAGIALQAVPLPTGLVSLVSPATVAFHRASALAAGAAPAFMPLSIDRGDTVHAWLAAACAFATFWMARTLFATGGLRRVITVLASAAVVIVIIAFAQDASETHLVYGVWRPLDAGARPLGPFVNRNHAGTWSVLALFLCFACFQWRRASSSPSRGWSWRARVAHALDGRSLILILAVVVLAVSVALGASRSTMLALACGAAYTALASPRGAATRRSSLWTAALALTAAFAVIAYADLDRVLSRVDETRQVGLAQRLAIWRDTLDVIRHFPAAGSGAGTFANVMRVYQTGDRTYYWNEAHNHYLQVAAEGGLLLTVPAAIALAAIGAAAIRVLRRREDPLHWMRLGASAALVAVAVQAVWETGLTLPANGMLAAVAAAILVHDSRHPAHAPAGN